MFQIKGPWESRKIYENREITEKIGPIFDICNSSFGFGRITNLANILSSMFSTKNVAKSNK